MAKSTGTGQDCVEGMLTASRPSPSEIRLKHLKDMNPTISCTSWHRMPSPLGPLLLTATQRGLSGLFMEGHSAVFRHQPEGASDATPFCGIVGQIEAYFAGSRKVFDLALDLIGSPFQKQVWLELQKIPYGSTLSYGELARRIGNPQASRAVGLANGRNPISIVIPCHRVIGSDGSLTGYGGGLSNKRMLLELEGYGGTKSYAPPLPMASTGHPSMASLH